jgi:Flp pilus assembly pilin Flp
MPPLRHEEIAVIRLIASFLSDDDGATATEYAVMLLLVLMGVFATVTAVGGNSGNMWGNIVTQITGAETQVP